MQGKAVITTIGCLYLPNGNPAPGPKFDYKLKWFERLISHAAGLWNSGKPVILTGDYNVMPTELDVYKPERWVDDALFRTDHESEPEFPGGMNSWQKYLSKQVYWPADLKFETDGQAVVIVSYAIDEEGKVVDAYVSLPLHPEFDRIALRAIQQSPKWKPAISHNRKIKSHLSQPITFIQNMEE